MNLRVDVRVFNRYRKQPFLPHYEMNAERPHETYVSAPVFVITEQRLEDIIALESDGLIRQYCREPILIFTDRKRVLAVDPQGYDYARYVCVIDYRTVESILKRI
ncbi:MULTISPECIES: hypothetical protein [Paenibacillus]|uniref:Uncharacterized protein n=1 Tax=Paenibacillus timonensis TaxID=225915 RepID=A0ABW3S988_9BACL|nr:MULTISPECIES: hypothetical protein [Paenibacillus]MCH1638791.1 hypothetical protein [Paenibacillus timonensis]MDU2240390.1 hypothetical protein [Paenibacillus sp.]